MKKRIVFSLAILCLVFLTAAALWDVQTMFCSTSYDGLHTGEITLAGDFFSMEHHLESVSMCIIDTKNLRHCVYTNSDHLYTDLLLYTDVCSLGLDFMHTPYEQYDIKSLEINGCEPFLQIGYIRDPERTLSEQSVWIVENFEKML